MDEDVNLSKKRKLENIAFPLGVISYIAQIATTECANSPSGLEQYLNTPIGDISGLTLALIGGGFGVYSIAKTLGFSEEKGLVTDGLHGVVRHTLYSSLRLSSLGMVITNPSIENIIAGLAVFLTTEITAKLEEKKLEALYGAEFLDYKEKVPMWIPYANHVSNKIKSVRNYFLNTFKTPTNS